MSPIYKEWDIYGRDAGQIGVNGGIEGEEPYRKHAVSTALVWVSYEGIRPAGEE
jgi:hypothetical protein